MNSTPDEILKKNGINVVCEIQNPYVDQIANYVATTISTKFPTLRLNYNVLLASVSNLKMYIAEMPDSTSGACYFYKNSSIYFKKGLSLEKIKKLAIHECIHYFQEIKDQNGEIKKLGLCTYYKNRAFGNALNEASVQLMSAYATGEKHENVTYYGITFPADSPSYYPVLCNLMKQIGYLIGFPLLFESTFYSNDAFFEKFKKSFGEGTAFKIQANFEKILASENKIAQNTYKIQSEDLEYKKFKKLTDNVKKEKENIKSTFFKTQNLIIKTFFDSKIKVVSKPQEIEIYRKYLYSFSNLIGTCEEYKFFNQYYIEKMAEIDDKYEEMKGDSTAIAIKKESKLTKLLNAIKRIFERNVSEDIQEKVTQNSINKQ